MSADDHQRPLDGITVLTLDHLVAGPFAAMVLSDLGADVINVEPPDGGDLYRDGTMPVQKATFNSVQRSHRSFAVDLKTEDGREVYFDLVREADAIVENFGKGVTESLGVGYDAVSEVNPDIVYASVKGFMEGEYGDRKALDAVAQAMSGMMTMTGNEEPMRAGTSVADMTTGLYAAIGILSALNLPPGERGQKIEAGLFESATSFMNYWLGMHQIMDEHPQPLGQDHPMWTPYTVFEVKDGKEVFIGVLNDEEWVAMCEAFDFDDFLEDERFDTNESRVDHADVLNPALEERFSDVPREEIIETLLELDITVAGVKTLDEVLDDDHLNQLGMFASVTPDYSDEEMRVPLTPLKSSSFQIPTENETADLGADTEDILDGLAYDREEIESLRDDGVVR